MEPPSTLDPTARLHDAVRQIRQAVQALREGVVQAEIRRATLANQVSKLDAQIADLESKSALADRINNKSLATEIRAEQARVVAERNALTELLAEASSAAETSKQNLPEEEARLLRQANDLKEQFTRAVATTLARSPASDMLDRALDKIRGLQSQAAALQETASSPESEASAKIDATRVDETAEQMLSALESRLGSAGVEAPITQPEPEPSAPSTLIGEPAPVQTPGQATSVTPSPVTEVEVANALQPVEVATATSVAARILEEVSTYIPVRKERPIMVQGRRVRVAAIGTGNIFRGAHLSAYPEIPQAQLVALCDPDPAAQKAAMSRYRELYEARIRKAKDQGDAATADRLASDIESVKICSDISEVIGEIKPDLVDICTQPVLHTPLAIQALEGGLNVMCEKPISRSWLETKRLFSAIAESGKLYQHNENWLWDPDYYTAQKLIRAGAIGEPIFMFLTQAHGGPEGAPKFWNSDFGGGGSLLDNGIHAIGAVWYMSGLEKRPTVVKAAAPFGMQIRMPQRIIDGRYQNVRVDDDAHILIRFEDLDNGAWTTAHVEGSWSEQDSPDTLIQGSIGSIKFVSTDGSRFAVITDANGIETRRVRVSGPTWQFWPSSFYGEILNMVECVRNGVESISSAQFGADCSAIVGCAYLSQMRGKRAVSLSEFEAFATDIEAKYPGDPKGADNALVDALLAAVR